MENSDTRVLFILNRQERRLDSLPRRMPDEPGIGNLLRVSGWCSGNIQHRHPYVSKWMMVAYLLPQDARGLPC